VKSYFHSDIDTPAVSAVVVQHIPTGLSFISISPRGYRSSFSNKSSPLTELSLSVVKKGPTPSLRPIAGHTSPSTVTLRVLQSQAVELP